MAGDWIKMRTNLLTHPKVVRMSSAFGADRIKTVGGIYAVWCLFDMHSEDGHLDGYTQEALDGLAGLPGISAAMASVGWLEITETGIATPEFDTHNGQSAKRRAQESERKRNERNLSASNADKKKTKSGPEKRREEKSDTEGKPSVGRAAKKCPDSFVLSEALLAFAKANAPLVNVELETATFRDHTFSTARSDWDGTWRNWIRKAQQMAEAKRNDLIRRNGTNGQPKSFQQINQEAGWARWEQMTGEVHPDRIKAQGGQVIEAPTEFLEIPQ
ncbi:hypothetical protein [Rhodoferax mekongensis]|uniref:Uncharacterized protein n=1 Tax=Rhodoferax mekongensis TaxID=3068341 RepID=A0ABZ0B3J4_9BURK|nr:hypothetical protein [Rhodoferax sp. TBRC 17307]WNO06033.1 hypothetical protein RAN89_06275 [Rhodoferax sp. TBRC 17307]